MPIATKTAETVQFLPHEPLACAFGPRRRESNAVNHQLIPALRHTVAQRPGPALDWFELGRAYLGTDNPRCAADAFRAALKNDAGLLAAKAGLARALTLQGYCIEAAQACFEGLTADAASMPLHRALAESLMQASLLDQAWKVVRTAISLDSGGVESSILSAAVLYQQDWIDDCLATLAKVLEIAPCHPQARQLRADALRATHCDHYVDECTLMLLVGPHPVRVPYLKADPELVAAWRARLGTDRNVKVGIAWAGNPSHSNDRHRSIALQDLLPLSNLPQASLYALQKGDAVSQVFALPELCIAVLDGALTDFADSAALMSELDLVISVDSSPVHLAGALGVPAWVLVPGHGTDWRWHKGRSDCPWYPSLRLFHQAPGERWSEVIGRVRAALFGLQPGNRLQAEKGRRGESA